MKRKNKQVINFSIIGLLALALGGGVSFMAFGGSSGNKTNIAFVANNGPNWDDGAFMTNSHRAVEEYSNNVGHANFKDDLNGEFSANGNTYVSPTSQAFRKGDDIVVSAGYNFAYAIIGQEEMNNDHWTGDYEYNGIYGKPIEGSNRSEYYGDREVVLGDDTLLASTYSNATSVNFYAEGGGFLSGVAAGIYSTYAQILSPVETNNYTNIVTPYAAMPITANYDYLSGFEQGVNWWNYVALGYTPLNHKESSKNKIDVENDKYCNALNIKDSDNIKAIEIAIIPEGLDDYYYAQSNYDNKTEANANEENWYIGDFPKGEMTDEGERITDITDDSFQNNAAIIFPVAGAASTYTYDELKSQNVHGGDSPKITQMIGVDSDVTIADSSADEYVLGSAIKNLEMGMQYGIWYADHKQENEYIATDINGNSEIIDPSDSVDSSTDFMKPVSEGGWNYSADLNNDSDPDNNIPGQQFTGTLENGGAAFTQGAYADGTMEITDSADLIKNWYVEKEDADEQPSISLIEIQELAIEQNPIFENASYTFQHDQGVNSRTSGLSPETIAEMPWLLSYNEGIDN